MENKKKHTLIAWIVYAVLVVGVIVSFVFFNSIFGPTSFFATFTDPNEIVQYLVHTGIPALIRTIEILVIAIGLGYLLTVLAKLTFHTQKGITISLLILNFLKWTIAIASVFLILSAWGANDLFVLASAGVITLIIGLGSQAIVADILAGIFIVFEGEFQVGDIVIVDGWRGEVKSIGVRTTRLVDAGGNIKIINNSDIRSIVNQTQDLSVAKCYVGISYGDRIERVEKVIADNLDKIKEKIPAIIEGPFYKGVSELADSSVNLLFVAKCKEADIYQVQRDLNREIKIMFDDNNINIPFPQIVLNNREKEEKSVLTEKQKENANKFMEEQRKLTKGINDEEDLK